VSGERPLAVQRDAAAADARLLAGALSAVAGLIHVQATVDHAGEYWLFGVLFGAVALAQIGLAVALWRTRAPDGVLVASAVVTLGVVAVWLVSRTVGLPVGPSAGTAENVGVSDAIAALTELVFVSLVSAIVRPDGRTGRHLAWLAGGNAVRLGVALGSAGVLAAAFGGHAH
jgi:integral membrane sensor domain MASE1